MMDQVHVIWCKVMVERNSMPAVAREPGVGRNAVTKYLRVSGRARRETPPRPRSVLCCVVHWTHELLDWSSRAYCSGSGDPEAKGRGCG